MKKCVLIILALLLTAAVVWCFIMDPFSLDRADVARIEYTYTQGQNDENGNFLEARVTFTITDENQIHYITDYLNNILPVPGGTQINSLDRVLSFYDHAGSLITQVTIPNHEAVMTERGTFLADMGELNNNLHNITDGEDLVTNMMFLPLLMIGWLLVIVVTSLAGLILFLIQMGICAKTDSLALRLLPTIILSILCLFNFRTQFITGVFYICSMLAFDDPWIGAWLIGAVAALCLMLGWRQGAIIRKEK